MRRFLSALRVLWLRAFVRDDRLERVVPEHLLTVVPNERADLFRRSVAFVEVEVHSFCNRKCWFCPNAIIDRRAETKYLDEDVYIVMLKDLSSIGYEGVISYSRYNEPFADAVFYERLRQAREIVPGAHLYANTNGDYLNPDTLARAYEAGLRNVNVQVYMPESDGFDQAAAEAAAVERAARLQLENVRVHRSASHWVEYRGVFREMTARVYARDFRVNGTNRGGIEVRRRPSRTSPCIRPFIDVYVDYSGAVMPCCNLRSDNPRDKQAVLGWLEPVRGSIFDVFCGEKAAAWRRAMIGFGRKTGPCSGCSFDLLWRRLRRGGGR